jgi:ketosteroid isomerase-like protein
MKLLILVVVSATSLSAPLYSQATMTAVQRQVFSAESSFAASMARRDPEAFAALLSPEAIFFADTTVLRGKSTVIEGWRPFFAGPAAPFSWKPKVIEVLAAGGLALSSGPVYDPTGKQIGTFNSIWRREPDGRWLVVFDKGCS